MIQTQTCPVSLLFTVSTFFILIINPRSWVISMGTNDISVTIFRFGFVKNSFSKTCCILLPEHHSAWHAEDKRLWFVPRDRCRVPCKNKLAIFASGSGLRSESNNCHSEHCWGSCSMIPRFRIFKILNVSRSRVFLINWWCSFSLSMQTISRDFYLLAKYSIRLLVFRSFNFNFNIS